VNELIFWLKVCQKAGVCIKFHFFSEVMSRNPAAGGGDPLPHPFPARPFRKRPRCCDKPRCCHRSCDAVGRSVFGRPFLKRFPMLSDRCLVCLSVLSCPVCNVGVLWPNGWPYCVRWGPSSPSQKVHSSPFSAHDYCGQTVAHLSYC